MIIKRVLTIIFALLTFAVQAQDGLNVKVNYNMTISYNSTYQSASLPTVECDLYIEDGRSKFNMYYIEAEKKFPGELYDQHLSIYKDFNKNEMYGRVIGYKNFEYIIKDSLNIIDWKIQDSTKVINGKVCKLATTQWRDFEWEVWYDESIPISDGPYKLHGLPGLIVEAKAISCNNVVNTFLMTKIEHTKGSFDKQIFFPFKNKEFKFIDYATMYKDESKNSMNTLKNNYLKNKESDVANNVITGRSCSSSITFDFCFCYP